jgi:predicted dehydrogenase
VDEWNVKGHSFELRHFIDCFLAGKPTESPLSRGYRALELVFTIYDSAEKKREIPVAEPRHAGR